MTYQKLKTGQTSKENEISAIEERYQRRTNQSGQNYYNPLSASVYMASQELERILITKILTPNLSPLSEKTLLEVGCGHGINLLGFIKLGFKPENLTGNELLDERVTSARLKLPSKINIIAGDATQLDVMKNKFDIVYQSTVFTSILDNDFQVKLANAMWSMVKPGGGILWYDFIYNNPRNPDVQGVPLKRIKELFPGASIQFYRTTLAPPISRRVTKIHPSLYTLFNFFPFLRTHVLCWISKPE